MRQPPRFNLVDTPGTALVVWTRETIAKFLVRGLVPAFAYKDPGKMGFVPCATLNRWIFWLERQKNRPGTEARMVKPHEQPLTLPASIPGAVLSKIF